MKIKGAWYVSSLPDMMVIEKTDGSLMMFKMFPSRNVKGERLLDYTGVHPSECASFVVPHYVAKFYGLEAPNIVDLRLNGISCAVAEKMYFLPEGTVRRDIHRGRFKDGEYMKFGRDWLVDKDAVDRLYRYRKVLVKDTAELNDIITQCRLDPDSLVVAAVDTKIDHEAYALLGTGKEKIEWAVQELGAEVYYNIAEARFEVYTGQPVESLNRIWRVGDAKNKWEKAF
jgi:hypothetical protein